MSQEMKICKNCGALLPSNAVFCGNCGAKVALNDYFQPGTPGVNNAWPSPPVPPYQVHQKKKNNSMKIIVIIVAILAIVLSIIIAVIKVQNDSVSHFSDADIPVADMPVETAAVTKAPTQKEYAPGIVSENTYESNYFNLRFTAPDGYVIIAKDELAQRVGEDTETVVWEMGCQSLNTGANILIVTEMLPSRNVSVESYMEVALNQPMGFEGEEIISFDKTKTIAGQTYNLVERKFTKDGITGRINSYLRKVDNRIIAISITYQEGSDEEETMILNSFSEY